MSKFKILFFALLTSLIYWSCGNPNETKISGTITNADDLTYYLEKLGVNKNGAESLLSGKFEKDGKYEIKLPEGIDAGIYNLKVGAKSIEFIVDGKEKAIAINGDLNTLQNREYTIEGSPLNEEYQSILKKAMSRELGANELREKAKTAEPLVAYMVASRIFSFREDFADVHKGVLTRLKESYPDLSFLGEYTSMVNQLEQAYSRKMAKAKIKVGMDAPEIELPSPQGNVMKLSDYKGKVVLIDFWASWCRPCRRANPHVVEIYNKYKDQGFDVFSVSLDGLDDRSKQRLQNDPTQIKIQTDRQKERWIQAIEKDKLAWAGHVSDLKKWNSTAAATYGVSSIPKTFLVGRDGKISAVDPRYNLEEAVKSAL